MKSDRLLTLFNQAEQLASTSRRNSSSVMKRPAAVARSLTFASSSAYKMTFFSKLMLLIFVCLDDLGSALFPQTQFP